MTLRTGQSGTAKTSRRGGMILILVDNGPAPVWLSCTGIFHTHGSAFVWCSVNCKVNGYAYALNSVCQMLLKIKCSLCSNLVSVVLGTTIHWPLHSTLYTYEGILLSSWNACT
jgi:hypothetical protein